MQLSTAQRLPSVPRCRTRPSARVHPPQPKSQAAGRPPSQLRRALWKPSTDLTVREASRRPGEHNTPPRLAPILPWRDCGDCGDCGPTRLRTNVVCGDCGPTRLWRCWRWRRSCWRYEYHRGDKGEGEGRGRRAPRCLLPRSCPPPPETAPGSRSGRRTGSWGAPSPSPSPSVPLGRT